MKNYKDVVFSMNPKTVKDRCLEIVEKPIDKIHILRTTKGIVETPHGFCLATSYFFSKNQNQGSVISIIKDGKIYNRFIEQECTPKTLVIEAKRFAAAIFKEKKGGDL